MIGLCCIVTLYHIYWSLFVIYLFSGLFYDCPVCEITIAKKPNGSNCTGTHQTIGDKNPEKVVPIFLKDIEVVPTDENYHPSHIVTEVHGLSPDINKNFGGQYVWLKPIWTQNIAESATGIQIIIQSNKDKRYKNLAKGAGGDFRYIKILRDPASTAAITQVALYRTTKKDDKPTDNGWQFMTSNINKGRGKDFLYLCWKTKEVGKI